jgi:hypothetical protein
VGRVKEDLGWCRENGSGEVGREMWKGDVGRRCGREMWEGDVGRRCGEGSAESIQELRVGRRNLLNHM